MWAQRFRRSIPLLFSVALLIFWWAILPLLAPIDGRFDASRPVNYWSLITPDRKAFVATTWFIFILVTIVVAISTWDNYRGCLFAISWLVIGLAVLSSLCIVFLYLAVDAETELSHIQTVNYGGHQYHLAVSNHSHGWDYEVSTYIVFECDNTGNTCRELTRLPGVIDPQEVLLSLNSDQTVLFLKQGSNQVQIRP